MRGGLVRERRCPACAGTVRVRTARWCGACGAPLGPLTIEAPVRDGPPWRRRTLVAAAGACALAVAVLTGDGIVDRTGPRSDAVRDAAVSHPDAAVLDRLEPAPPPPVPLVEAPTCTRTATDACFRWAVETGRARSSAVAVADGMLISADASTGTVVARDVDDGAAVWSAEASGFVGGELVVADDLLLHAAADGIVGRDLTTGLERWRSTDGALGGFTVDRARRSGEVLVTAGELGDTATGEHAGIRRAAAVRLDPATGRLLWLREGLSVSLAAGGATVLTAEDGSLQVLGPDGDLRWQDPERIGRLGGASAWARGHVVVRFSGAQRSRLFLLRDGTPLGLDGHVVGSDDEHSLVQLHGDGPDTFALLDERGEVWRAGIAEAPGCVDDTDLGASTVEVTFCDGGTLTLDLADGSVVDRTEGTRRPRVLATSDGSVDRVGPYEFRPVRDVDGAVSGLAVSEGRTGARVALLPAETAPIWDETRGTPDLGGRLVLQGPGSLVALDLPERSGATRPPSPPADSAALDRSARTRLRTRGSVVSVGRR